MIDNKEWTEQDDYIRKLEQQRRNCYYAGLTRLALDKIVR